MRRLKLAVVVLMLVMMVLLPTEVYASEPDSSVSTGTEVSVKNGLLKENGRYSYYVNGKKWKGWKTIGKYEYYFTEKGYAVTTSINLNGIAYVFNSRGRLLQLSKKVFYRSGKNTYYVDTNGQAATGWFMVGSKLHRADPKGRLYKNRTYEGVVFTAAGNVRVNTASKLKIKTMKIVQDITNPKMSKAQKLKACWNYLVNSGRFWYRDMSPNIYKPGWQKEFAYNMLVTHAGSCSSFACAFAALANEVGYDPYIIYGRIPGSRDGAADGMTRHCWVKIDGRHYDPEGVWAGWSGYIYGNSSYPMYHTITKTLNFADFN